MQKKILITGATDGIGLATARLLAAQGQHVLLHGRNPAKLTEVARGLEETASKAVIEQYVADLSNLDEVMQLAQTVLKRHESLDVLINNAGVFKTPSPVASNGLDVRFIVNTIAPYVLTQQLTPVLGNSGRVVNLSSAAQAPVSVSALLGEIQLDDMGAYAQSKLAITMWSRAMAASLGDEGPLIVAVNPGSLLASKMVKEGFGMAGNDLSIGAKILVAAALSDEFSGSSGRYFDNDAGKFASPHPDGLDDHKTAIVMQAIESIVSEVQ